MVFVSEWELMVSLLFCRGGGCSTRNVSNWILFNLLFIYVLLWQGGHGR